MMRVLMAEYLLELDVAIPPLNVQILCDHWEWEINMPILWVNGIA